MISSVIKVCDRRHSLFHYNLQNIKNLRNGIVQSSDKNIVHCVQRALSCFCVMMFVINSCNLRRKIGSMKYDIVNYSRLYYNNLSVCYVCFTEHSIQCLP